MRARGKGWTVSAAITAVLIGGLTIGCEAGDALEPSEGQETWRAAYGEEAQPVDDEATAPGESSLQQSISIKWKDLLNPKTWGRGLIVGVVWFIAEELLVSWYSSDYVWQDEILARAEMHRRCGSDCLAACEANAKPPLSVKQAIYTASLRWRLFPSGWWYAFTCVKCDCEYQCNVMQQCGDVPAVCAPQECPGAPPGHEPPPLGGEPGVEATAVNM